MTGFYFTRSPGMTAVTQLGAAPSRSAEIQRDLLTSR